MTLVTQPVVKTLGDYAYQAIQKHFNKNLKWEKTLKNDEHPEALHQMRVGIRRLRTIVSQFGFVVDLPSFVTERNIGKIARRLGKVRDLDLLKESLEKSFQPHLPSQELKHLEKARDIIDFQRSQEFLLVQETLKDARYKFLKSSLSYWLEEPKYQESALLPINLALPDLLLPEVSNFLLHPGWQFGMSRVPNNRVMTSTTLLRSYLRGMTKLQIEQSLDSNYEVLHSLRKQAKRLHSQMELFTEFYGSNYTEHLTEVKNVQNILGEIHNSDVLEDWLIHVFGKDFTENLPTLTNLLVDKRHQLWQQWVLTQKHHTQLDKRNQMYLAILHQL